MELICKAILFDLDGVLINSSRVVERHWKRWANSHDVSFEHVMKVAHGRTSAEIIRLVAPHLDAEEEGQKREAAEGVDIKGLKVFSAASELLRSLPNNSWAVVTSGNLTTAMTRLRYGEFPSPPVLITADDVGQGKPDPEAYLLAAKRLSVTPEQCVVIEDAPAGIEAAHAGGMRAIAVSTTHPPQALIKADIIASEIANVLVKAEGKQIRIIVEPIQTA